MRRTLGGGLQIVLQRSITDLSRRASILRSVCTRRTLHSPIFSDMKATPAQSALSGQIGESVDAQRQILLFNYLQRRQLVLGAHFDNFSSVQYPESLND